MKKILFIILPSFIILSCANNEQKTTNQASLSGTLNNIPEGSSIYLDYLMPTALETKDTAITDAEGNYTFDYKIEETGYYRLRINNQNFINLILEKGQAPIVNGDGTNLMDTYSVEGSKGSQDLKSISIRV